MIGHLNRTFLFMAPLRQKACYLCSRHVRRYVCGCTVLDPPSVFAEPDVKSMDTLRKPHKTR